MLNKFLVGFMLIWFLAVVAAGAVSIWALGSLITSYVKVTSHECGKTYEVEKDFNLKGNWFCVGEK